MTWTGDISKMGQLAKTIGELARVPSRAAPAVAKALTKLVQREFTTGTDPYGNPWKPLAASTIRRRPWRGPPPLTDTRTMRRTLSIRPTQGAGLSMTIAHPAAPHQTGWAGSQGSGPARPIFPMYGLPATWRAAIKAAMDREMRR